MELQAELRGRDGQKWPVRVRCEAAGGLRGLLSGLSRLQEEVAALLGPLVQLEGGGGDRADVAGDENECAEDEDEEENHVNAQACPVAPPLKRKKTHP